MKTIRWSPSLARLFSAGLGSLALLGVAGCSNLPSIGMPSLNLTAAPLQLDVAAIPESGQRLHAKRTLQLLVTPFRDARPAASGKIGNVSAAVNDMLGSELYLQDIPGTVTAAMQKQLAASGFQVVASGGKTPSTNHDFELSGVIRDFTLNIAGRDEVSIVVETTLRDSRTGKILWAGSVAEKADRFAGITGNTRNSITRYLSEALAKVSAKTREAVSTTIVQVYPELFHPALPLQRPTDGVTVLVAPTEPLPATPLVQASGSGRLTVSTTPSRAKVYLADVYYGLSPLKLELEAGIHTLHFKHEAYQPTTEKVSVRKGETTELEIKLEK